MRLGLSPIGVISVVGFNSLQSCLALFYRTYRMSPHGGHSRSFC